MRVEAIYERRTIKLSRLAQLYCKRNQILHIIPRPDEALLVAMAPRANELMVKMESGDIDNTATFTLSAPPLVCI